MKHAELFAGYGGLGLAVEQVFGAELAWLAEFDPAPSRIMARHWPDAPNYGDVTTVDWAAVEPVEIISGGSPCQDVSAAGRRAGMNEGTRSNLWVAMREAIATIKPTYVVWENVRGAHSAKAYSAVESEPGLLGESRGAYLRATGRVVGDLAELGYDAEWRTVSAASVGAPHRRERVFVLAWRRDATTADRDGRRDRGRTAPPGQGGGERADAPALLATRAPGGTGPARPVALLPTVVCTDANGARNETANRRPGAKFNSGKTLSDALLPTPRASHGDKGGPNQRDSAGHYDLPAIGKLLPTPTSNLGSNGGSQHPDKRRAGGHSVSIQDVAEHLLPTVNLKPPEGWPARPLSGEILEGAEPKLLPTPRASRGASSTETAYALGGERSDDGRTQGEVLLEDIDFGPYAPAIERWEKALGRPAPSPTELSPRGKHRLSEFFTEWMMGLPEGWICDTEGITRNDKIKAAGNGVVPQQAAAALADMLQRVPAARENAA